MEYTQKQHDLARRIVNAATPERDLFGRPMRFAVVETLGESCYVVGWAKSMSLAYEQCVPDNPAKFVGIMNRHVVERNVLSYESADIDSADHPEELEWESCCDQD